MDLILGADGAGDRAAAIKVDIGSLAVDGGAGAFEQRRQAAGGEVRGIAPDNAARGRAGGRDVGALDFDPGVLQSTPGCAWIRSPMAPAFGSKMLSTIARSSVRLGTQLSMALKLSW